MDNQTLKVHRDLSEYVQALQNAVQGDSEITDDDYITDVEKRVLDAHKALYDLQVFLDEVTKR